MLLKEFCKSFDQLFQWARLLDRLSGLSLAPNEVLPRIHANGSRRPLKNVDPLDDPQTVEILNKRGECGRQCQDAMRHLEELAEQGVAAEIIPPAGSTNKQWIIEILELAGKTHMSVYDVGVAYEEYANTGDYSSTHQAMKQLEPLLKRAAAVSNRLRYSLKIAAANGNNDAQPAENGAAPQQPGGDATNDVLSAKAIGKGIAPRDAKFLEWYEAIGTDTYHKPAKIHAKWESMTATERAVICPDSPNKIAKGTVDSNIKRARMERDSKTPTKKQRKKV
jgi:hypothetical protein